jgi:hypothetical protein
MGDNLTRKQTPDRGKINVHQPHEFHYWTRHLNVSKEDLHEPLTRLATAQPRFGSNWR